ncbi:protein-tyrosine phosphatase [Nocardioides luteus]|uniref:Phosphotyrosine protein phosphatase I domain-containing protein n=1 Tax=Nocardioides luteus TaxID=1844 RepID=A0ABQ5SW23_9ACTN|nr:hypothetical protein [Nocardioides luteus]MDR7309277.1 protein-tyrosine phosphatase [Nocardioides luteus]GGR48601.1 hypothetical protein GCM10010197_12950 [Nocardioides luteus]GLJ67682.1 hypothetical protein GCM10017579_17180 [Nocardioides luteus]
MDTATILVVCTGNVRRSPAIEAMLREGVGQVSGLARHGITVISAGSEALEGYDMDPMIASEVALAGVRLTRHQAYRLDVDDIESADLIITAERSHRSDVARLVPSAVKRTFTLIEIAALGNLLGRPALGGPQGSEADAATRLRTLVQLAPLERARRRIRRPSDDDLLDLKKRSPKEARRLVTEARGHVETLLRVLEPSLQLVNKASRPAPAPVEQLAPAPIAPAPVDTTQPRSAHSDRSAG